MAPTVYRLLPAVLPSRRLNHTGCRPCIDFAESEGFVQARFELIGSKP